MSNEFDDVLDLAGIDDPGVFDLPAGRGRLFAALGWAAVGLAATAGLAIGVDRLPISLLDDIGLWGGTGAVIIAVVAFFVVVGAASGAEDDAGLGHLLLWSTCVVDALLINVFTSAFGFIGPMYGYDLIELTAGLVAVSGAAVLAILAIAIAIGIESTGQHVLRWLALIGLVTGACMAFDTDMWWVGLLAGFALANAVDVTLRCATADNVGAPALAACLVAGITALVLVVLLALIRFVVRFGAEVTAAAAEGAAGS